MSRANGVGALLKSDAVDVTSVEPTGDCFYEALAIAVCRDRNVDTCISELRDLVAAACTADQFAIYRMLWASGEKGYAYMEGLDDVEGMRAAVRQSGRLCGPGCCVWADHFAMQTVATAMGE